MYSVKDFNSVFDFFDLKSECIEDVVSKGRFFNFFSVKLVISSEILMFFAVAICLTSSMS